MLISKRLSRKTRALILLEVVEVVPAVVEEAAAMADLTFPAAIVGISMASRCLWVTWEVVAISQL